MIVARRQRSSARRAGFTVVELAMVIGIVALLCTILVSGYVKMQQNARIRAITDRVISNLQIARNMAINNSAVYRMDCYNYNAPGYPYALSVVEKTQHDAWIGDHSQGLQRFELQKIETRFKIKQYNGALNNEFYVGFNPDGTMKQESALTPMMTIVVYDLQKQPGGVDPASYTDIQDAMEINIFQSGMIRQKK